MAMQVEKQSVQIYQHLLDKEDTRSGIHAAVPDHFQPHPFSHVVDDLVVNVGQSSLFERPVRIPTASFREASSTSLSASSQRDQGANPWLQLLALPLGLGALGAGVGALTHPGERWKYALRGGFRGVTGGSVLSATACAPTEAPLPTEVSPIVIPVTEVPVQVTVTPLSNEVVEGTPSSVPETPAPVIGASYPSEVINLESPLVYSYGGEAGRQNMDEYTRQMFDRYIAEMGPNRGGFITGATVEELYRSFDQGYDFKLYTTDNGLTWLVQSKSDGSFLVPKDQNGQIFRDLQLPYDYLFQSGAAVAVGTDNFDFQQFDANKVGFVGAWPVLVNVNSQDIPVSWANMEQGGAVSPIIVASTAEAPTEMVVAPTEAERQIGETSSIQENGQTYTYTYTNLGKTPEGEVINEDVREVGTVTLYDTVYENYVFFKVLMASGAENERSFVSMTSRDRTTDAEPITPLSSVFAPELETRYFADDPRRPTLSSDDEEVALQLEMMGKGEGDHAQAYLDIIVANGTPEGSTQKVKLSVNNGIILTIMNPETIAKLGGQDVIELHEGEYTFYVQVVGVDDEHNEIARVAFKDPIDQIPEDVLRKVLFSIPGSLVDHKDQREQGFSEISQIFADYSAKQRQDGKKDVEINLLPPITTP